MHSTGPRFPGSGQMLSPHSAGPRFAFSAQASPKGGRNSSKESLPQDSYNIVEFGKPYTPAAATAAATKDLVQPRMRIVTDPSQMPTPTINSRSVPSRDMIQPSHRYADYQQYSQSQAKPQMHIQTHLMSPGSPYGSPSMSPGAAAFASTGPRSSGPLGGGPRLSPYGASSSSSSNSGNFNYSGSGAPPQLSPYQHHGGRKVNSRAQAKATNVLSSDFAAPPMSHIGTSYAHVPNAPNRPYLPLPESPTIPRVAPMLDRASYRNSPQLNNRLASGQILGAPPKRYVAPDKVMELPDEIPEDPLGPDNPYREIDETWTACWDNEASAVYYYNKQTGEATWLPPE